MMGDAFQARATHERNPELHRVSAVPVGIAIAKPGRHCFCTGTPAVADIKAAVCSAFDIPAIEMVSARRARAVARPRQVAMYLAREMTPFSLPHIGRMFGNRDHTTVLHACRQVELRISNDEALARQVQAIVAEVKSTTQREKSDTPTSEQFLEAA